MRHQPFTTLLAVPLLLGLLGCTPSTPTPRGALTALAITQAAATRSAGLTAIAPTDPPASTPTSASQAPVASLPGGDATATLWPTPLPTDFPAQNTTETLEATPTLRPSATPAPPSQTPTQAWTLASEDDFQQNRGWAVFDGPEFSAGYSVGRYRIKVKIITANSPVFSIRQQEYTDVALQADILRYEGPTDGYFGLICRFIDIDNYYRFVVAGDGGYSIGMKDNGEYRVLAEGSDSEVFLAGKKNVIRSECLGDQLRLYLNGNLLLQATDSTHPTGFIGLVAGTPDRPDLVVLFDNFKVEKP